MNERALQEAYDCYNDEVAEVLEDLQEGLISADEANIFLANLSHNLDSEIREITGKYE
jgi:hypothetical protein